MRRTRSPLAALAGSILLAGCTAGTTPAPHAAVASDEPKIKANLDKLDPEDRKLAQAQRWCVIEDENRLGEMGTPYKITVKGQPVFLCCKGCQKSALADPERTLAKVEALKASAAEKQ